jgi:hypothetical protein
MLKKYLNIRIYSLLEAVAAVLAIITAILGMSHTAMLMSTSFTADIFVFLFIGAAVSVSTMFLKFDFIPVISSVFYSVAFAFVVVHGAQVIMDKINNITFSGGNADQVISYVVLLVITIVISVVACFISDPKAVPSEKKAAAV